ncbi:MAG: hypothetical protein Q9227_007371 [Pyrenula ochraceoflavens]
MDSLGLEQQIDENTFLTSDHSPQITRAGTGPSDQTSQRTAQSHDYNFTGRYDESSTASEREDFTDEEMARLNETSSSRSSISSLPASVAVSAIAQSQNERTPTKSPNSNGRSSGVSNNLRSPKRRVYNEHDSPFRHPSSVCAMQMRDEDEESILKRRRESALTGRLSNFSARTSTSLSPSKRHSRSVRSSSQKPKLKQEYPLVLLHCTLLPPTLQMQTKVTDPMLLQEILPQEYRWRWKLLNDRILQNGEISSRGVLIPHPRNDYDLLEERLLESLELAQPRLRGGHFLGTESRDGTPIKEKPSCEEIRGGPKCPDCGTHLPLDNESRKWEVKVYAANGLMRAGAWSAAWNEMEKVDVEVGLWLPENVRQQIEDTLRELNLDSDGVEDCQPPQPDIDRDARTREIYGDATNHVHGGDAQDDPLLGSMSRHAHRSPQREGSFMAHSNHTQHSPPYPSEKDSWQQASVSDPDMPTLLLNSIRVLARDRRNVTILFLSILVLFFAMVRPSPPTPSSLPLQPTVIPVVTSLSPSLMQTSTTDVSGATSVPTVAAEKECEGKASEKPPEVEQQREREVGGEKIVQRDTEDDVRQEMEQDAL